MKDGWFSYTKTEPVFEQGQDFTKATFYFEVKSNDDSSGSISSNERTEGEFVLTDRQKEVLALIKTKPTIGYREVGEVLNINQSAAQKHFEALKEKGVIERVGTTKTGYWKVRV
jgi:predicted HTH transcriptional regulator